MISKLQDWFDHRTGYRGILHSTLFEPIPGGARWRYVWGSTLIFAFAAQLISGFFLWMCYSPSSQTAWESVYYIQHEMAGGWLVRGIHHFMAQAMVVLIVLHMGQVIIDGAYRAPREVNFWIGLLLLQIVLALSLTGYLLPWDQKGYWATQVATNILGIVPVVGQRLQSIVIGGPEYGHLTLTRFFALHAGLLPFLMIVLTALHVYVFRRHGITARQPHRRPDAVFWVDQVLMDSVACLGVLLVVLLLTMLPWITSMGQHPPGAELGVPADPSSEYAAAPPEWYFLFLFELLKQQAFAGEREIYGAVVIPGAALLIFAMMPIVGRWRIGHRFNIVYFGALMISVLTLTSMAMIKDRRDDKYLRAVAQTERQAERAVELAHSPDMIPLVGARALLASDPLTRGPRLFSENCASCHRYNGGDGMDNPLTSAQGGSDLAGFASRAWIEGLLNPAKIDTPHYFGATKFKDGKMVGYIKDEMTNPDEAKKTQLKAIAAALSDEAQLKSQRAIDAKEQDTIRQGREYITGPAGGCTGCHTFHDNKGTANIPELTGYGSRQWMISFITDPSHPRFYGPRNDRMPAFGAKKLLSEAEIGLIVDWLRGEWYEPGDVAVADSTTQPTSQQSQ